MGLRPPDVSAGGPHLRRLRDGRHLDRGRLQLGDGLSALRPPPLRGRAPPEPHPRAQRGAGDQPRRWRCLRLAVPLRRGSGPLEPHRRAGPRHARVPAARRLLHVRRFPRPDRVGRFHGKHAPRLSRPSRGGHPEQRPDLSHDLRSRRPVSGPRAPCFWRPASPTRKARPARSRTGAASTTITAA